MEITDREEDIKMVEHVTASLTLQEFTVHSYAGKTDIIGKLEFRQRTITLKWLSCIDKDQQTLEYTNLRHAQCILNNVHL